MKKTEFLEKLKALTASEDVMSVSREINELKGQFEDFTIEEDRLRQVAYLEAKERGEDVDFEMNIQDPLRTEFYDLYHAFKDRRNSFLKLQKAEHESNYAAKRNLLERLKELIDTEEDIKRSYDVSKEIHEQWIATGEVMREKRQDIQAEYFRLRESFFTNLQIFKELREYDLKKNHQIKDEIIEKIIALKNEESIKHIEASLKTLQNEFNEVGPVPREEWENVREKYWSNVKEIYQRIQDHYNERKSTLESNIQLKQELLDRTKTFVSEAKQLNNTKDWETATKKLIEFQQEWKGIGFGLKKQNEVLWQDFRAECDTFFQVKREFYDNIKDKFEGNTQKKRELITQIEALKNNTDWKETTAKILKLQERWKSIGHAGQRNEQGLWKDFRKACDDYFNAKDIFFKEQDAAAEGNLTLKQALIEKIKTFTPSEDKKETLETLKAFATEFNAIGKVPFKVKDSIYNEFKNALDVHYKKLKLEGAEKDKAMFQAQLDHLKAAPNSNQLMDKTKRQIEQQIQTLKQDIIQYENNLGFISNAKPNNPIVLEINSKIRSSKQKIEDLKSKLTLLNE